MLKPQSDWIRRIATHLAPQLPLPAPCRATRHRMWPGPRTMCRCTRASVCISHVSNLWNIYMTISFTHYLCLILTLQPTHIAWSSMMWTARTLAIMVARHATPSATTSARSASPLNVSCKHSLIRIPTDILFFQLLYRSRPSASTIHTSPTANWSSRASTASTSTTPSSVVDPAHWPARSWRPTPMRFNSILH